MTTADANELGAALCTLWGINGERVIAMKLDLMGGQIPLLTVAFAIEQDQVPDLELVLSQYTLVQLEPEETDQV